MVGDAPGDQKAAVANRALFFPINPGAEEQSWERLFQEGIDRFLGGTFAGDYQTSLLKRVRQAPAHRTSLAVESGGVLQMHLSAYPLRALRVSVVFNSR